MKNLHKLPEENKSKKNDDENKMWDIALDKNKF